MKRLCVCFVLLLLLTLPCLAAPATQQLLELQLKDNTLTLTATKPVTFFERPQLQAGEQITVEGALVLKNNTAVSRNFTLTEVVFPYDDPAALEYLNHLQIEVFKDGAPLYIGAYSGINDERVRADFACTLSPTQAATYTIRLQCDFAYAGTNGIGDALLDWKFDTPVLASDLPAEQTENPQPTEAFGDPLLWQWAIGGGVVLVILAGLFMFTKK